jgi:hypothetical protein
VLEVHVVPTTSPPTRPCDPPLTDRPHPRFHLHFTPTRSSWLNLERWISELTTKNLQRVTHRTGRELNTGTRAWISDWNDNPGPYIWTKSADQILDSIAGYYIRINDSRHGRPQLRRSRR